LKKSGAASTRTASTVLHPEASVNVLTVLAAKNN